MKPFVALRDNSKRLEKHDSNCLGAVGKKAQSLARFVLTLALVALGTDAVAQCPPVVVEAATQAAELTMKKNDGSCEVADGGFIKKGVIYRLHITASVTGRCQVRVYQTPPGACQDAYVKYRTIATSTLKVDSATEGAVVVNPSNTTTIQNYDTRTSTNTLSAGSSYLTNTLGTHVYTSSTNAVQTSCTFSPASFAASPFTFHALACEPKWLLDSNNNIARVPATTIQVFLDPATMSAAAGPLADAIASWNAYLSSTGVVLQPVSTPCGSGADCISVQVASLGAGSCGYSPAAATDGTGVFVSNRYLQLNTNWATWSAASLERTFAHELGHSLGLDNYDTSAACGTAGNTAAMQPNFTCGPSAAPSTAVTANDYVPVDKTSYGGGPQSVCGF